MLWRIPESAKAMKSTAALALALALSLGSVEASALDMAGVKIPELVRVEGESRPWPLVGHAQVQRSFIPFFGLALYRPVEYIEDDPARGLTPLRLTLVWYTPSLPAEQVREHFRKAFERAAGGELEYARLGNRVEKFLALLPDATRGNSITFHYSPDAGIQVSVDGGPVETFAGIDFNRAFLAIWFGPRADPDLREALGAG
jgi:hypothetical protein